MNTPTDCQEDSQEVCGGVSINFEIVKIETVNRKHGKWKHFH